MKIEEKILLEENEHQPNLYLANIVLYGFVAVAAAELLNEFGIFHVHPGRMRFSFLLISICTLLVQRVRHNSAKLYDPKTKYYAMFLIFVETLVLSVLMPQWTELLLAMPVMLAVQYHTKKLTRFALIGAMAVASVSAPLCVYLKMPQLDFYSFLIRSIGYQVGPLTPNPDYDVWYYMFGVFKYVSLPRCILLLVLWPLAVNIAEQLSNNVRSRADATYYSSTDVMTGLYNRYGFEGKMKGYEENRPAALICVYADADGLHALNNSQGHAAGDELLRTCSRLLRRHFGEWTFRMGGDEFLSFLESENSSSVAEAIDSISLAMVQRGYHLSMGMAALKVGQSIEDLVKEAEQQMYNAKRAYYTQPGMDRREAQF